MPGLHSLTGKFLIAMPGIGDPRFEKSVVLLCMHTRSAAMGVVLNKPRKAVTIGDVLGQLGVEIKRRVPARPVLEGGPVKPDRGFVLHSEDFAAGPSTQDVAPGVRFPESGHATESRRLWLPQARKRVDQPSAALAALFCLALPLSPGGAALLITLSASASYIAVPAAMRLALPEARPAIYLTLSLAVTFPFNLTIGLPIYLFLAARVTGGA
jgi:hypothetical protein